MSMIDVDVSRDTGNSIEKSWQLGRYEKFSCTCHRFASMEQITTQVQEYFIHVPSEVDGDVTKCRC